MYKFLNIALNRIEIIVSKLVFINNENQNGVSLYDKINRLVNYTVQHIL